jgi:hypothetical protein
VNYEFISVKRIGVKGAKFPHLTKSFTYSIKLSKLYIFSKVWYNKGVITLLMDISLDKC